jgi:hypothetical protein
MVGSQAGDPLSLMLFVLVMECFNVLINTSEEWRLFLPLGSPTIKHHISLYADDVVVFISLVEQDLLLIKVVLYLFVQVMGLVANFTKS